MFGIDKSTDTAIFLGFGNHMQGECCFARRFRPVNFNDTTARQTTHAQRNIKADRAG